MRPKPVILLWIFVFIVGCAQQPSRPATGDPGADLTFVHLNDTYRVDAVEEGDRGGFSRVASLVRALEAAGNDVRVLHGGDFLYPSLESQLWAGEQMIEAMNFLDDLAPLYAVPGNHEFDPRAAAPLIERVRESRFDWLGDNVRFDTGAADVDGDLKNTFTFRSGDRTIGVFALTIKPADGGNTRDYTHFAETDYTESAERAIEALEQKGVDLIIGLTHLHLDDDLAIARLKARHPKFMFIVGGHEHEPEYAPGTADSAAVMKGASNARTVWQIDVFFDGGEPRLAAEMIELDTSVPLDAEYQEIATKWRSRLLELMPFLEARIGEAAVPLDGREVAVRNGDSNWGMFIVDQMRSAFGEPPAELAFVNSGTLRIDDFIADDITFEDIGRTFGFSSHLRHLEMDGDDFRTLLEAGYRGFGPSKGYFPQISGFRVCVDRSRPEGERIVEMQVPAEGGGWQEIDPDATYTVVAPDFLFGGGDGYDFSAARDVSRPGPELVYLVLDAIIEAQAAGEKVGDRLVFENRRFALLRDGQHACFD